MKSLRSLTVAYLFSLLLDFSTAAQTNKITAAEAKDHVEEIRTVCGKVVSTHYASGSKGQPTFLNLDEPYPKEAFTILIWGNDCAKFGTPRCMDLCASRWRRHRPAAGRARPGRTGPMARRFRASWRSRPAAYQWNGIRYIDGH